MTMLAHSIKNILELVPEALPLLKQASVDQEMPLDNKDSVLATALQVGYFEKVAYSPVDVFKLEKIAQAVKAYKMEDTVKDLTDKMVKAANDKRTEADTNNDYMYLLKVSSFEGAMSQLSTEQRSQTATELYKEAKNRGLEPSDDVTLYSGNGYLSKEAAVKALSVRFDATKNQDFVKIAQAIVKADMNTDLARTVADAIDQMDKTAGLHFKGHNFYKEAFFVKEAAFKGSITVNLGGKQIPYESIERVGKQTISQYIGADVAKEMDAGPMNFKTVVETLPMDLQRVLLNLTKNV